jgi:hypothetical protein
MSAHKRQRSERWWACYSFRQHAVHLETEAEGLATNLRAFQLNRPVDFVPLSVFDTHEAARAFLRTMQEIRNQRGEPGGGKWN